MTRFAILLSTGILASIVLLGAQVTGQQPAATTTQPSEQRTTTSAEAKVNPITMSGCLKPGTSAGSFILTNAGMPAAADSATPAPQGTAGSTKSYTIVAKPETDLSKHVNHKIEVTGTVSASKPSSAPTSQTSSVAAAQPTETFTVDSFKMVAMACP